MVNRKSAILLLFVLLSVISIVHAAECNDGIDNDGDEKTDYPADTICKSADDVNETIKEELMVKNVTLIMPPAYYYSNQYYSGAWGYPWNYDGTKIIIYEVTSASLAHPAYGTRGRGWVWANVQDLVDACNNNSCMNNPSQAQLNQWVADYLNVTHDIPDIEPTGIPQYYPVFHLTHQTAMRWSKTSNLLYFIDDKGSSYFNVKSYNIDTGAVAQVFQLPAQSTWNGGNKPPIIFGDFFNGSKLLISTLDPANIASNLNN